MLDIANKHIVIVGAARSGIAAAKLVCEFGGRVFLTDTGNRPQSPELDAALDRYGMEYEFGGHSERASACDIMIVSPGVPSNAAVVQHAERNGATVWSELELGFRAWNGKVIAVTGSNGKTTTTTMIGEVFEAAGMRAFVAGNIGTAFSDAVIEHRNDEWAILEVSSFQLERIELFRPDIAVITNITPDHLDRYEWSMAKYIHAKKRITMNMNERDVLIYNAEDEVTIESIVPHVKRGVSCSLAEDAIAGVSRKGNSIIYNDGSVVETLIDSIDRLRVKGAHNAMNAAMAAASAAIAGVKPSAINDALIAFRGVPHRLEFVDSIDGTEWYNDSKATNVDSVVIALRSFDRPVILIAGGRDKGGSYAPLNELVRSKIKLMIVIGEASTLISEAFQGMVEIISATTLQDAVNIASDRAERNDIVLLSPACSSYDMFDNYEQRGDEFRKMVHAVKWNEKRK